ncbi:MAG: hypothetical protein EOO40_06885, partial [Deltaproteobacteria bacterium]
MTPAQSFVPTALPMHLRTPTDQAQRPGARLPEPAAARAAASAVEDCAHGPGGGGPPGLRIIERFDAALLQWVRTLERPYFTYAMRQLTKLGDAGTWVMFGLLLFACGGVAHTFGRLLAVAAL